MIFGGEAFFARNYKRKQNAIVLSQHLLTLELRYEAFDLLVKD
jgi:hypothetical protein